MKVVKKTQQAYQMWKAFWLIPNWINYKVTHNIKKRAIRQKLKSYGGEL